MRTLVLTEEHYRDLLELVRRGESDAYLDSGYGFSADHLSLEERQKAGELAKRAEVLLNQLQNVRRWRYVRKPNV